MSEGKKTKAIRLLKETPFNFVDFGKHRGGMPDKFKAPADNTHWNDALACMAVLRSKPDNWQWTADRVQHFGGLSERSVKRGVRRLKEQGWIQHVNVYDKERLLLGTFILVFSTPLPEEKRGKGNKNRFSMILTDRGWILREPGAGFVSATSSSVTGPKSSSQEPEVSVHPPSEHYISVERTQTLKRACSSFSSEPEGQKEKSQQDEAPAKQGPEIANRKHLVKRLRQLGEKRDQSDDDTLAYEEFVTETFYPALELPPLPEEGRKRSKQEALRWMQDSLLGILLLEMSSSTSWDVTCARRVIRRCNDGYINFPDLRVLIMAFRWHTRRSERKNLRAMTYYGTREDPMNGGKLEHVDSWGEMIRDHRFDYKNCLSGTLRADIRQIHPDEEDEYSVNQSACQRLCDQVKRIFTYKEIPDEKQTFNMGVHSEKALAYIFSSKRRSEKTERLIAEAHDELVRWMATDYTGVLVFRGFLGRLEEDMGIQPDEVRKAHHEHIDKLTRRANCHGLDTRDLVPLI